MKYYYKTTEKNYLIQECPYFCSDILLKSISESMGAKIGSYSCTNYCNNIIDYNNKEKYVICKPIIENQRLKKLNSL